VDPAAAAARIAKHWRSLGYSVRTVVPTQTDNFDYTEMSADLADGAGLGYTVSKKISGIQGASECSTDPALSTKTK
jgi:translation initiation factor 1 (eIF-1/SUI1)